MEQLSFLMKSLLKDRKCANFKPFQFVCVLAGKDWERGGKTMTSWHRNISLSSPSFCTLRFFYEDIIYVIKFTIEINIKLCFSPLSGKKIWQVNIHARRRRRIQREKSSNLCSPKFTIYFSQIIYIPGTVLHST